MRIEIIDFLLVYFAVFIGYELLLKLFFGSVELDILMISLLMFNIAVTWKVGSSISSKISSF
jgi:hypothetical protein